MFCKKCGEEIAEGYKFCKKCGTKIDLADNDTSEKKSENEENFYCISKKRKLIVAKKAVKIVLGILVVIGIFLCIKIGMNVNQYISDSNKAKRSEMATDDSQKLEANNSEEETKVNNDSNSKNNIVSENEENQSNPADMKDEGSVEMKDQENDATRDENLDDNFRAHTVEYVYRDAFDDITISLTYTSVNGGDFMLVIDEYIEEIDDYRNQLIEGKFEENEYGAGIFYPDDGNEVNYKISFEDDHYTLTLFDDNGDTELLFLEKEWASYNAG